MKLLSCIAFHYRDARLVYLQQVLQWQQFLADEVHVVVTTNTADAEEIARIQRAAPSNGRLHLEVASFETLPHPWLLPWAHKIIFAQRLSDPSYTHFMYTEDDIELSPANVAYWLRARVVLRPYGLYPSFLRVEWSSSERDWMTSDAERPISLSAASTVAPADSNLHFVGMKNPYQGMFFYDRELMQEHAGSPTFDIVRYGNVHLIDANPTHPGGGVAERAAFALTFENPPDGFGSRNVIPFFSNLMTVDSACLVRHLPNNYANNASHPFAKLAVRNLLSQ